MKMPASEGEREFLIEYLKEPEHAADLLEAILEEKEPEPELLRNALKKVVEARLRIDSLSESAKQQWEKLDKMLSETGGSEIYTLVELLEALGFRLAVTLKEENTA
jgi:DNA-binding phage protein